MILFGYLAVFAYIFFLIFCIGPVIQKRFSTEASRKVIHISLFFVWVLLDLFFRHTIHQIIIPICFLVLNALSYKFKLYKSVERETDNHFGTVYFAIAVTIIMTAAFFRQELFLHTGIAVFCLTFGDGFAALVGHSVKSRPVFRDKSLGGMLGCGIATFVSLLLFRFVWMPELTVSRILLIALLCPVLELVPWGLDNFSTTLPILAISYFLSVSGSAMEISLYIAAAVMLVVFAAGAISYFGSLLAAVIVFSFSYFGGYRALVFLLICYFSIFAVSKVRRKLRPGEKKHSRGFAQILINGGFGTFFVIAGYFTGNNVLSVTGLVSIAGCFIDSVSSDVGTLSRKLPFDIFRWKYTQTGLSGGVSWLGTLASLAFTAISAGLILWAAKLPGSRFFLVSALIFSQTLIDTCLGSLVQVKYRCAVCGCLTEKKNHCNQATEYHRGIRWIDNNMVNLISAFLVCCISLAVLNLL